MIASRKFSEIARVNEIKYDNTMTFFAKTIYKRVREDYDVYIAATGWEGVGKSTLVNTLGFMVDPNFSLEKNVLYSPDYNKIKRKMIYRKFIEDGKEPPKEALPPYSFINIDEAIRIVYKLEQWSGVQRFLKKLFALARDENKIIGMCIPNFLDMGNNFRSRMNYWVDVYHRSKKEQLAYATIDIQSMNKYKADRWNLKDNEKIYEKGIKKRKYADIDNLEHEKLIKRTKNYMTSFCFPPLPKELEDVYKSFKVRHKFDDLIADEKKEGKAYLKTVRRIKLLASWFKELNPKIKDGVIAKRLGVSRTTISTWVSEGKEITEEVGVESDINYN